MPYDHASNLWPTDGDCFFRDRDVSPIRQYGLHCVSTVLAMLTSQSPETFQGRMNTQDPVSWSAALSDYGMKLAYCPTDVRKLCFYLPELIRLDDLFTLSYYSPIDHSILDDPDENGWVCGSHIVILHRSRILDPASGRSCDAWGHDCGNHFTKRVFRVVPLACPRGL